MRARQAVITSAAVGLLVLVPTSVASAAPTPGGCRDFGANVSGLARDPAVDFGGNASGAARAFPGAFPQLVVRPEQERFCGESDA
ncbi:hypothetical protein E4P41_13450 [Geodermatophilus sp. DF01-2]|uniref:hypothetical protein n=1 Tax=Geodermatophilus sp. DF01-2 TaxID=2559610 RepID=UPI00107492AA|nr:hypothetical protein [Geodermatophilus sp. DF01_2]TFV58132.1 hypothetical protein E4P41_13450 [Geodermatophilus sp. DF01_2]